MAMEAAGAGVGHLDGEDRGRQGGADALQDLVVRGDLSRDRGLPQHGCQAACVRSPCQAVTEGADPSGRAPEETDRKSTRLNSSHVAISYAVFCLKQKKF